MKKIIESAYEARKYEDAIYKKWESSGAFKPKIQKGKDPFVISMPPPNATGALHLGHAVMLALEDVMVRYNRMKGIPTLWLPGTDHAAIATQSVVEKKLQEQGILRPREELGREKLLQEIRTFVDKSKDTIKNQIRKMGASCDWSREKYTLDSDMNHAVNTFFKYMYDDGLIYRGGRIVNWDPKMQTTVADDELEYKEEKAKFYYFKYGPVIIGTARPETKFLDKVIVVHPKDKRYKNLVGKEFELEWIEGKVKARVIADECIDMNFGTGAMTITPAHSAIDFDLAQRHKLFAEQIIDFDGRIRKDVSTEFGGMPIAEAREKIVEKLKKKGLLVKIDENYLHNVAVNYRGKGRVEPQIMKQWFIDVNKKVIVWKGKKRSIKEVMQDVVKTKMITILPERFEKVYFHWIDNLRDWCISRQIWWGHQIPVWYDKENNDHIHVGDKKPAKGEWTRDPDTLDTWFSASLWTFATLGWPNHTPDFKYFHPTSVMETGYDIIFFWVARMILASTYALRHDKLPEAKCIPFKTVYLHGLVRDRLGRKMSKSHPETCIDPLEMIEKHGTDAVRLSLMIGSSPGNDTSLYEEKIAGYRNFVNKIWNGARFALMSIDDEKDLNKKFKPEMAKSLADKWILTKLQILIKQVDENMRNYRFSDAGIMIYDFVWKEYCDWYLEISKGKHKNSAVLVHVLKTSLKLLHPFIPYVTEKLWEQVSDKNLLINEKWPEFDKNLVFTAEARKMEIINNIISKIRSARAEMKVEPAKKIHVVIHAKTHTKAVEAKREPIMRLGRLEGLEIKIKGPKIPNSKSYFFGGMELYLPLKGMIDPTKELARLKREIEEKENFIKILEQKLRNKEFLKKAPKPLVEKEQARLLETRQNLKKLLEQMASL